MKHREYQCTIPEWEVYADNPAEAAMKVVKMIRNGSMPLVSVRRILRDRSVSQIEKLIDTGELVDKVDALSGE